jgi:hypothetical protein
MTGDHAPFQTKMVMTIGSCPLPSLPSFPPLSSFFDAKRVKDEKRQIVENIKKARNLRIILNGYVIEKKQKSFIRGCQTKIIVFKHISKQKIQIS